MPPPKKIPFNIVRFFSQPVLRSPAKSGGPEESRILRESRRDLQEWVVFKLFHRHTKSPSSLLDLSQRLLAASVFLDTTLDHANKAFNRFLLLTVSGIEFHPYSIIARPGNFTRYVHIVSGQGEGKTEFDRLTNR